MAVMLVQEAEAFHHPGVEAIARMTRNLAHNVKPLFEPLKFAASRRREDRDLAIFALVAVLRYCFAIESEMRFSDVCTVVFIDPEKLEASRRSAYSCTVVGI